MSFGLCNAPAYFQRVMNQVFSGLIRKCCFVYLDDVDVFFRSPEEDVCMLGEGRSPSENLRNVGLSCRRLDYWDMLFQGQGFVPRQPSVRL